MTGDIIMKILTDANIGEIVKVGKNDAKDSLKERLLALGLTNGAKVEVLRKGPKNNLTVYRIRGAMIALRNEESRLIKIL
jgi:ferrous iron transport protein A